MKTTFFILTDDFEQIIKSCLPTEKIVKIKQISTGWTNMVFEANTSQKSYIFRFPRNEFWAKMMIKDCTFCNFIEGKTTITTPKIKLLFDHERPFSCHEKITGQILGENFDHISDEKMAKIIKDLAQFSQELGNIDQQNMPIACQVRLVDFLDEMANCHFDDMSLWQGEFFESIHTDKYLIHGDLNPGNIIIDRDHNVVAIIDFCFAGLGNPYADISRIIGRSPNKFKNIIIKSYEKHGQRKLDSIILEKSISAWTDIETAYVEYIRQHNPDIKLPTL